MRGILTLTLLSTVSLCAYADMVFMNFHESPSELRAVEKAAKSRGEKLWVISPKNKDTLSRNQWNEKLSEITKQIESYTSQSKILTQKKSTLNSTYYHLVDQRNDRNWAEKKWHDLMYDESKEISDMSTQIYKLQKQINFSSDQIKKLEEQRKSIEKEKKSMKLEIENTFKEIEKSGNSVTSIIISGHHVGDHYWGDESLGIYENELQSLIKKYPNANRNLTSIFAWGCHTGELSDIYKWKAELPQLKNIIGFAGSGPLAEKTLADATALEDVLLKDSKLSCVSDVKTAESLLRDVKDSNVTYLAGLVNSCYVGTAITDIKPSVFSSEAASNCNPKKEALTKALSTYKDIKFARNGFEDIPVDDGPNNPLRTFYNYEETYSNCYTVFGIDSLPSAEEIVNLIHFKNIQKNFESYYGIQSIGKTRKEVLSAILKMPDKKFLRIAFTILNNLSCVPPQWITEAPVPGRKPDAPNTECLNNSGFRN